MIYPQPLKRGDKIAIVSPASKIDNTLVDNVSEQIKKWGFTPIISNHCKGVEHTYSGTLEERLSDIRAAFEDSEVKAILCSRGGYGVVHLLEYLPADYLKTHAKWVLGFSDITALHAAMVSAGVVSIHSPMCKHLVERGDDICSNSIYDILTGKLPRYIIQPHKFNNSGSVSGKIVGGNVAVMTALLSTPVNIIDKDVILFIEDISEAVYKIERMLYQLKLNGVLAHLKGLIVGQFTEYSNPDNNGESMEEMIHRMTAQYNYPIAFNFPIGHVDYNLPIIEGATATLDITATSTTLTFIS